MTLRDRRAHRRRIDIDAAIARARSGTEHGGAGPRRKVVSVKDALRVARGRVAARQLATSRAKDARFHVVAYDFGVKRNILRMLAGRGCRVTVVPAQTSAADALALSPDGVFLSNGPGDPEPCDYAIAPRATLIDKGLPTFGICLGHQILRARARAPRPSR